MIEKSDIEFIVKLVKQDKPKQEIIMNLEELYDYCDEEYEDDD